MSVTDRTVTAFVLDMSSTGLGVARSLGREGISVVGADFRIDAPGLRSTYCRPMLTPHPVNSPDGLLDVLLQEGRKLPRKAVLYPASDPYVLFVSRFRKVLSEYFLFALPSEQTVECILDKRKQYELAEQVDIRCPKSYHPRSYDEVSLMKDRIEYPALVKPCYSHLWQERFPSKGFKVSGQEQLLQRCIEVFEAGLDSIVQEIVPGPITNIVEVNTYLSREGKATAAFAVRKVRQYPVEFGVGTLMESIHSEETLSLALTYLGAIGYRGIANTEFKRDDRDGTYKLIELNARPWTQVIQATCAGINFPLIQYMDLTDQPIPEFGDYKDGIKWLDAARDLMSFHQSHQGRGPWPLAWLRSIWNTGCYAYYSLDDPMPFLRQYRHYALMLARRMLGMEAAPQQG